MEAVFSAKPATFWGSVEPGDKAWLRLIEQSADALPFHRPEWLEVLSSSYGFRPFVLGVSEVPGELEAGLPLLEVKDPIRGRRWVALPFTDRCPPLQSSSAAGEQLAAGLDEARREAGVRRLDVRARVKGPGLATGMAAVTHLLGLTRDYEAVERSFSSSTRRNLRKAQREDLSVRSADSEDDLVRVFYDLHERTRRRLGVPVQPRRFFRELWRQGLERGLGHALIVLHSGRPVAAGVFLVCGKTVVYKFGASDARSWELRPNNVLLAEAIRYACESGAEMFDFGRSDLPDSGLRRFKTSWGAVEEPLVYTSAGGRSAETQPRLAASVPGRAASAMLRRAPLWVGRALGSAMYRYAA